jgi:hypothetical protein
MASGLKNAITNSETNGRLLILDCWIHFSTRHCNLLHFQQRSIPCPARNFITTIFSDESPNIFSRLQNGAKQGSMLGQNVKPVLSGVTDLANCRKCIHMKI